jgi:limonene-1,2-epoxide hydrolase
MTNAATIKKGALGIVQDFQHGLASGGDDWTRLITDDIAFIGPVAQVHGKEAFIELNRGFFPNVRGYQPITAFEQGNRALLEGVFTVHSPASGNEISFGMAEIYETENGKIQTIRVYYDAEEFRREFGK